MKKIKDIVKWQNLENIIGLRLFLKFCNYYWRFIAKWLKETELFTRMIKNDKLWKWDNKKTKLFKKN